MHANRRAVTYSTVVIVMAVLLSAALLQLTQTTAQSASLARSLAQMSFPVHTLTITKTVEGDAPVTDWQFEVQGSNILSTVNVPAAGGSTSISVPFGVYSVTEVVKPGYWLSSVTCDFPPQMMLNGTVPDPIHADLFEGDNACEFVNSKVGIELTKTVGIDPAECAQADELLVFAGTEVYYCYEVKNTGVVTFPMHWLDDDPIGTILDEFPYNLGPGDSVDTVTAGLTISDVINADTTNVATWTAQVTYGVVLDLSVPIAAAAPPPGIEGDSRQGITITVAATDTAVVNVGGQIIVDKVTDPAGSAQAFDFTLTGPSVSEPFTLTHDATPFDSGPLLPGSYSVTETVPSGWVLSSTSCDDADPAIGPYPPDDINLQPGVTVTCVFTNVQLGRIIVDKVTDPASSDQSFNFTLTDGALFTDTFSLTGGAAPYDSGDLVPGNYSVAETPVEGWDLDSATCTEGTPDDITLSPGATMNCTFTNTQVPNALDIDPAPAARSGSICRSSATDAGWASTHQSVHHGGDARRPRVLHCAAGRGRKPCRPPRLEKSGCPLMHSSDIISGGVLRPAVSAAQPCCSKHNAHAESSRGAWQERLSERWVPHSDNVNRETSHTKGEGTMHANRRTLTYSSLVVAMAVLLSVALLQLTQTTAKSAAPAAPLADIEFVPLVITKTVEVGPADSPWTFEVESSSILYYGNHCSWRRILHRHGTYGISLHCD